MYLILGYNEIEALSQFRFWLNDQAETDALSQKDEDGRQHRMTVDELADDYEATSVFNRIDAAWRRMHGIGRP